jgi:lipopolysaccharide transport system ATP-binding protein
MAIAISVENLSKRYVITHKSNERYKTLRDTMSDGVLQLVRSMGRRGHLPRTRNQKEEFWALRDIDFEINSGDKVGIIGRNGAGKSTLLKVLSRITEPTSGLISISGRVASLLEVGTGFHPELSGRENIFLNGAILGMSKRDIQRRFDEIVDFSGVERFLDTPVKRYSSGMYVRLAFSVAAHLEPEILIVDEVLAVGDAQFQQKCLGKMSEIGAQGRTVIFVSHNMGAIQSLTSRCLWLKDGMIESIGTSEEVVSNYFTDVQTNSAIDMINTHIDGVSVSGVRVDDEELGRSGVLKVWFNLINNNGVSISELAAGVQVVNSIGCRIGTARAKLNSLPPESATYCLSLNEHRLPPGHYSFNFGMDIDGVGAAFQERILSFEMPDLGNYDGFVSSRRDVLGVVFPVTLERTGQR